MNKYDYGYEIQKGSTIEWAYHKIEKSTTVLEIGPSIGNLLYHLTAEKECIADLVEIDESAGSEAARFGRNCCLGVVDGNLELNHWYKKLKNNKYDYIIVLDVLEHVRNPKEVLGKLRSMLKEDGEILLSIPNIAHNSVILQLLNNDFEYTSVGLLDDTHVHFFTYSSIKQMIQEVGLFVKCEEVIQIPVGGNEIDISYGMLPKSIESFLKTRSLGTAYQYLFTLRNKNNRECQGLRYKIDCLYNVYVFNKKTEDIIFELKVNPMQNIQFELAVDEKVEEVRIDPLNANCILENLQILAVYANGKEVALPVNETTGIWINDKVLFFDDDPQIYISNIEGAKKLKIHWSFAAFDNEVLDEISPIRELIRQQERDASQVKEFLAKKDKKIEEIICDKDKQIDEIIANKNLEYNELLSQKKQEIADIDALLQNAKEKNKELKLELEQIGQTIWGKAYYQFHKSKRR